MAAFATMAAAEARVRDKVADGTWINAHAQRDFDGTISVRVQRKMAFTDATTRAHGGWVEITDDATT